MSLTHPIGFGIRSDVVDKEGTAYENRDFIKVWGVRWGHNRQPVLEVRTHTKQHMKGFVGPPSQENEEWQPEKGELDAQIDCKSLGQF